MLLLCLVTQLCLTLFHPMGCSLPGSSVHGVSHARILEWVAMPSSRGSSQPGESNSGLPQHWWILYHLSHQGSPENTGVGSLSLLQGNVPKQESNWGLLQECVEMCYLHLSLSLFFFFPQKLTVFSDGKGAQQVAFHNFKGGFPSVPPHSSTFFQRVRGALKLSWE